MNRRDTMEILKNSKVVNGTWLLIYLDDVFGMDAHIARLIREIIEKMGTY